MPIYSDLNQYNPTIKPKLTDIQSVYQSLYNLFNTRVGERLFSRAGIDLEEQLFEIADDLSALEVFRIISDGIEEFEPRVNINYTDTKIIPDPDNNQFVVNLSFGIQGIEGQSFSFQGVLKR